MFETNRYTKLTITQLYKYVLLLTYDKECAQLPFLNSGCIN